MALIGKSNERTDDSELQNTSRFAGTNLTGWAGIENYVMKHDSATMKDYADDIDTLLVFAALFSAILTTFVVQTYQLLQPGGNDTTNQLIAYQIFSQGTHTNMPPTINATISTLLATSSFTPSLSARWINGLFFFSLVISLVAALFGIMARQWIREYLKWNAPLANPRQNVLVRQIRFDSWEAWKVEAFIWSIPVLQELAMVLFLIGVVVLVWTLDDAVAISVTILVAIFLAVILVITVLPVFVKRCPYRSPTAWACVRLVDLVLYTARLSSSWISYSLHYTRYIALLIPDRILRIRYIPSRIRRLHYRFNPKPYHSFYHTFSLGKTWRTDDIEGGIQSQRTFRSEDVKRQLAREATHLGPDGTFVSEPDVDSVSCEHCFYDNLTQSPVLVRALEWVSMASPGDSQITACIDQCMVSVHPDRSSSWSQCTQHVCQGIALTYLHPSQVLVKDQSHDYGLSEVVLWSDDAHNTQDPPRVDLVTRHRINLGVIARLSSDKTQQVTFCLNTKFSLRWYYYTGDPQTLRLRLLAADLASVTAENPGSPSDWIRDDSSLRRVFEWLSMMTAHGCLNPSFRLQADHYLDGLRSILNDELDHKTLLGARAPGLRTLALILTSRHAKVSTTENRSLAISVGSTEVSDYETLLTDYFNRDPSQLSEDDLNIVVIIGWRWLGRVDLGSSSADDNIRIVKMIQDALEASLARSINPCRFLSYWNELRTFQVYKTLDSAESGTYWFSPSYISVFTGLVHVMESYFKANLHDFDLSKEQLHQTLAAAHSKLERCPSCSLNACPWISHSCDDVYTCPLLESKLKAIPPPAIEDVPIRSTPQSNGETTSSTDGEAVAHKSFLSRSKIFWRKHARFAKPTDEESSWLPRNGRVAHVPDIIAVASVGDTSDGGIAVDPSRRIFSALTSEEGTAVTDAEISGIPLVALDNSHSPSLPTDDQYVAAEAGLAGGGAQHATPNRPYAHITGTADALISDVEPTYAGEASSRDDPDGVTNSRVVNPDRDVEPPSGGFSTTPLPISPFARSTHPNPPSESIHDESQAVRSFSTMADTQYQDEAVANSVEPTADVADEPGEEARIM